MVQTLLDGPQLADGFYSRIRLRKNPKRVETRFMIEVRSSYVDYRGSRIGFEPQGTSALRALNRNILQRAGIGELHERLVIEGEPQQLLDLLLRNGRFNRFYTPQ